MSFDRSLGSLETLSSLKIEQIANPLQKGELKNEL
jgi:hypothetical protein